jgi:hypothetical protein
MALVTWWNSRQLRVVKLGTVGKTYMGIVAERPGVNDSAVKKRLGKQIELAVPLQATSPSNHKFLDKSFDQNSAINKKCSI